MTAAAGVVVVVVVPEDSLAAVVVGLLVVLAWLVDEGIDVVDVEEEPDEVELSLAEPTELSMPVSQTVQALWPPPESRVSADL